MFQEFKFECPGGYVKYQIKNEEAHITSVGGRIFEAIIPDTLSDCPVTTVEKKAFMASKVLKTVSLPATVTRIGDYALSACSVLESVEIRNSAGACTVNLELGQSVFTKDYSIKSIDLLGNPERALLCGCAASKMNAEYLLVEEDNFYSQWDAKLLSILGMEDDDGFVFMVLCGEEDLTADIDEYKEEKRQLKSELAFLRLMNDMELKKDFRDTLVQYLKTHTCGCESDAAFQVVLKHYDEEKYVNMFFDLELLNDDNYSLVLSCLGDRYAPFKAKILARHEVKKDFFASLMV